MSSLEKVTIMSVEDENVFKNIYVTSMYNPKELSFTKSVNWATVASGSRADFPNLQYTSGSAINLSVELFFDRYEDGGDVREDVRKIMQFVHKHDELDNGRPPKVQLVWGQSGGEASGGAGSNSDPLGLGKPFTGVVKSAETKYTMFLEDGTPCRASVKVTITQADVVTAGDGDAAAAGDTKTYSSTTEAVNANAGDQDALDNVKEGYEAQGKDMTDPATNDSPVTIQSGATPAE